MNNRSIKYNIIMNLILSGIYGFIVTFIMFILSCSFLHIFFYEFYVGFAAIYNSDQKVQIASLLIVFTLFIFVSCIIFIKKMDKITDYIEEISKTLNLVASGNMEASIDIKRKDELGTLAGDVNKMAYKLNENIRKEREWEQQKYNLITNLSHDLRTPLTSILGFLELIEKGTKEDEKVNHYCNISLSKAKKLKVSIDKLFEFTKINNADLKLNKVNIGVEELIEQSTMGFIPAFEENNMEYNIISKCRGLKINADPILLARVFENIISNSIKYASDGRYLNIVIYKKDDKAAVSFINYGQEIKKEDLENIFDSFYRTEKLCGAKEGTGLGLAIVKTIVELHSGDIKVKSSSEKTVFEILLPL